MSYHAKIWSTSTLATFYTRWPLLRCANLVPRKAEPHTLNLEKLEREAIAEAVRVAEGNVNQAAELLGITRYALYRKIEKHGL